MPYLDNVVYTPHAIEQMDERLITSDMVEAALANGEIIEEYETDEESRYLILGEVIYRRGLLDGSGAVPSTWWRPIRRMAEPSSSSPMIPAKDPETGATISAHDSLKTMTEPGKDMRTSPCPSCPEGQMREGTAKITLGENPAIVITDVPAEVCEVCGEVLIDRRTTRETKSKASMIRLIWRGDELDFPQEGLEVGGTPGSEEGGVVRLDYDTQLTAPEEV